MTETLEAAPISRSLGLDLGGTNIKWAVVDGAGDGSVRTLDRGQVATPIRDGEAAVVARLIEVAREAVGRWPVVASVGIGVPGPLRPGGGRRGSS